MKLTPTAVALVLASASIAIASPAAAQYATPAPRPQTPSTKPSAETPPADENQPKISNAARKEIVALQAAVTAKKAAEVPALVAAAQAKAKTKDDRYVIAKLQLKSAIDANDNAAIVQGIEAVIASEFAQTPERISLYLNLGKLQYNAKVYDKATVALQQALQLDPANIDATITLAETHNALGRPAEAVAMIQKAIAARVAAGQKPEENWYKRAVQLALDGKMPTAPAVARDWVTAYPSPKNWRDTIRIWQRASQLDDASQVDSMRLSRATNSLQGENDYYRYANTLVTRGFAGEAKAVLDQGIAANAIDKNKSPFNQLYALASTRAQGDRASLAASATAAKAAPDAKKAMTTAEAYYGYGDYTQAADLLRVALAKSEVDKDLANLRLGMALAQAGDKAGATAALNAAGGVQSDIAKLWLAYLATKA